MPQIAKLLSLPLAGLLFLAPASQAAQTDQSQADARVASVKQYRHIRAYGSASAELKADRLFINLTVQASAASLEQTISALKARRDELSSKAAAGNLNVEATDIQSLDINRRHGDISEFQGRMQLAVRLSGFEDPLDVAARIADERVSRVGGLRYGFSEELLNSTDLCAKAIADAQAKAKKQAEAAGRKLGKIVDQQCSQRHGNWAGRYGSELSRTFTATANVSFEQVD
jgi:uncharacterized protein YggE